jgi:hypothetical protein
VLSCLTVNAKLSTLPFPVFISQGWVFFSCILRGVGLLSGFGIGICYSYFPPLFTKQRDRVFLLVLFPFLIFNIFEGLFAWNGRIPQLHS